jgi:hypothetical protein
MRNLASGIWLLLAMAGCASTPADGRSPWPEVWNNRRFHKMPHAYVYASSRAAASEAELLARSVREDFAGPSHIRPAAKPLLIVNDVRDVPILGGDAGAAIRRNERQNRIALATTQRSEAQWVQREQEQREKMSEMGVSLDDFVGSMPLVFSRQEAIDELKLPAGAAAQIPVALIIPTEARIQQFNKRALTAGLRKQDISLAQRLILAPLLPLAESAMLRAMAGRRDVLLFQEFAWAEPTWTAEQRRLETQRYNDRIAREAMGPLRVFTGK